MSKDRRGKRIYFYIASFVIGIILIAAALILWNNYRRAQLPPLEIKDEEIVYSSLDVIEEALKRNPNNPDFLIAASDRLIQTNDFKKAKKYLKKVTRQNPASIKASKAHLLLARLETRKNLSPEKLEEYSTPPMTDAVDKELVRASLILDDVKADKSEIQSQRFQLAEYYWSSKKLDRAIEEMKKAVDLDPDSVTGIKSRIALVQLRCMKGSKNTHIGELDAIASQLMKQDSPEYMELYFFAGQAYSNLNYYDRAFPLFDRLVKRWPDSALALEARIHLAWIAGDRGRIDLAVNYLRDIIHIMEKHINNPELDVNPIFAMMLGDTAELPEALSKFTGSKIPPEKFREKVDRITHSLETGDRQNALKEMESLLDMIPGAGKK
ncbi:MAG: tetratricopeptide repeat protein [Chloroflexi bacterium]|nr:tetratricopeptide repeat protein [Chloroflexota bacterium]